ncbi:uncharacterized protein LTR77_002019 [Saxophila tyrrhenica]|uniref:NAD(P)-binding domain-containing protein n=1 Tax=Saxophila tyrrhenica TaxID=1690608 RepID=A0AAV9PKW6_9PEZI|nr:hypothetical protein LTR77_002019 [Saxophila tyrrhenica]
MRFLVLGASGRTGQLVVDDALKRGHQVTALVRTASSMKPRDDLTIVEGTPMQQDDIAKALNSTPSQDPISAVVVTLNAPRASDSPFAKPLAPPNFIRDCVRNISAVMAKQNVKRLVMMSAFGIGSSETQLPLVTKLLFRHSNMSYQMNDHHATDAEIRSNDTLSWTLVRPVMLKEGDAAPVKEFGEFGKGAGLLSGITRASVAEFMLLYTAISLIMDRPNNSESAGFVEISSQPTKRRQILTPDSDQPQDKRQKPGGLTLNSNATHALKHLLRDDPNSELRAGDARRVVGAVLNESSVTKEDAFAALIAHPLLKGCDDTDHVMRVRRELASCYAGSVIRTLWGQISPLFDTSSRNLTIAAGTTTDHKLELFISPIAMPTPQTNDGLQVETAPEKTKAAMKTPKVAENTKKDTRSSVAASSSSQGQAKANNSRRRKDGRTPRSTAVVGSIEPAGAEKIKTESVSDSDSLSDGDYQD